ncbi:MAG: nucleotidyltransferase family protein [Verrucomicrobiota bacterium]
MAREIHNSGNRVWPDGCWPNDEQLLLLKACLFEEEQKAQQAFRNWEERIPFPLLDLGSRRLILTLYQRLQTWQVDYRFAKELRAAVQGLWIQQQGIERELGSILDVLQKNSIEAMLLKGAALNAVAYPDCDRLMSDLDLIVPRERARDALNALQDDGWIPQFRNLDQLHEVTHACHFRRGASGHLDLHWDFFHGRHLDDSQQEELWQASTPIERFGRSTRTLCAADQLLHTCEHGVRYNEVAPLRWLMDATHVIRQTESELNWERLPRMAEKLDLVLPVDETLRYLEEMFEVPIPKTAFPSRKAISLKRKKAHATVTKRTAGGHHFWEALPSAWIDFRRLRSRNPRLPLLDYLARVNDLEPPLSRHLPSLIRLQIHHAMYPAVRHLRQRYESLRRGRSVSLFHVAHLGIESLEGFHDPEMKQGRCFRWSFPLAVFRLPIPEEGSRIEIHLFEIRTLSDDLIREIKIEINGHRLPHEEIRWSGRELSFKCSPSHCFPSPLQRIDLRCPKWEVASTESRELGLPISWVKCLRWKKGGT